MRLDPSLNDLVETKIPIWLELGYRFSPAVRGNVYLELAPTSVNSRFCSGRSCDGSDIRFGVALELHPAPRSPVDPWLGIGFGYERLEAEAFDASAGRDSTFSWSGWELPLLQAGLDLSLSPHFTLGPYGAWSLGRYTSFRIETPGFTDVSGDIDRTATHAWFQVGVRAVLKL